MASADDILVPRVKTPAFRQLHADRRDAGFECGSPARATTGGFVRARSPRNAAACRPHTIGRLRRDVANASGCRGGTNRRCRDRPSSSDGNEGVKISVSHDADSGSVRERRRRPRRQVQRLRQRRATAPVRDNLDAGKAAERAGPGEARCIAAELILRTMAARAIEWCATARQGLAHRNKRRWS
jgi:hypothetical protein